MMAQMVPYHGKTSYSFLNKISNFVRIKMLFTAIRFGGRKRSRKVIARGPRLRVATTRTCPGVSFRVFVYELMKQLSQIKTCWLRGSRFAPFLSSITSLEIRPIPMIFLPGQTVRMPYSRNRRSRTFSDGLLVCMLNRFLKFEYSEKSPHK